MVKNGVGDTTHPFGQFVGRTIMRTVNVVWLKDGGIQAMSETDALEAILTKQAVKMEDWDFDLKKVKMPAEPLEILPDSDEGEPT
jgi:hypothetical protein